MFYSQSYSGMLISEDDYAQSEPPMSPMSSPTNDAVTSLSSQSINETFVPDTAVGLSNPQLSHGRRRMLDLVNKLHSTGCVSLLPFGLQADSCENRVQVDIDLPR